MMKETFYFICVEGGTEPWVSEPFATYQERDAAARECWERCDEGFDNIFSLNIDANGVPNVGSYTDDDLNGDEEP